MERSYLKNMATLSKSSDSSTWGVANPNATKAPVVDKNIKEVETPITPVNNAVEPVSGDIKPVTPEVINKTGLQENIQGSLDVNPNLQANEAFIQGVAKLAGGVPATAEQLALKGRTLSEVITEFGVGEQFKGFGISEPAEEALVEDITAGTSALDKKSALADSFATDKGAVRDQAKLDAGIATIQESIAASQEKYNALIAKIEKNQTDADLTNIVDEEAKIALKNKINGQPIPMSEINKQMLSGMEDLDQAQRLERLYTTYEANLIVNEANSVNRNIQLQQGNYAAAMDSVKESVDDWTEMQAIKLEVLQEEGQLEKEERARLESEINYERELGLAGYTQVEGMETYNKLVKDLGVTADTFSQFFYKDPSNDKIYLKPREATIGGGSGGSGGGAITDPGEQSTVINGTVEELINLRTTGFLNDENYKNGITKIMTNLGLSEDSRGDVESRVNQMMSGEFVNDPIAQFSTDAVNWAKSIQDGTAKLSDITSNPELKTEVNSALRMLPPPPKAISAAEEMVRDLKALRDHSGLDSSVGPNAQTRVAYLDMFGNKGDFLAQANKLVSQKALDKLIESKSEGATFGALSDREMDILKSAATTLGTWEMKGVFGIGDKLYGYDIDEKHFKAEIQKMIDDYGEIINEAKDQDPMGLFN